MAPLEESHHGTSNDIQELDALIVGAGFGGVYQLKILRDAGFNVKLVESGSDYGGVWYWNRYPGARVDSSSPHYGFSDPDLWQDWSWKQRFPGSEEIRAYFAFVADKWELRNDTQFDTFVSAAEWDDDEARWTVQTRGRETYRVKFLLLNTGFAAKRYVPDWEGVDSFKGINVHPSNWPHEGLDLAGKKVAIIGTGSTGVQITQELSKITSQLTVFQRTPNMSLPMLQVDYNDTNKDTRSNTDTNIHEISKSHYPALYAGRNQSFGGFDFTFLPRATFDDTPSQREQTYQDLWNQGDFKFWLSTYHDMLFSTRANASAYNFWRDKSDKTRARIHDQATKDLLAPQTQPHAFGCKRISLGTDYFEAFNLPHVSLVDISSSSGTPITSLSATGITTTTTTHYPFDVIIPATGYDAITGGLLQLDIKGQNGETLRTHWTNSNNNNDDTNTTKTHGTRTYLGMAVAGLSNLFFTYGPQAPTAFCNGPTCAQLQGTWIRNALLHLRAQSLLRMEAQAASEARWTDEVRRLAGATLMTGIDSWYMGSNIPGKHREPLVYLGGVPAYSKGLQEVEEKGYEGFDLS